MRMKKRLIMEMEAIIEECASLESQQACLRGQIDGFTSKVDQLKNKEKLQHKFSDMNIGRKKAENEVKRMEMEQKIALQSTEKRMNKKVMAMFEKAEDEYYELISKKSIIEGLWIYLFYYITDTMAKLESLEGCAWMVLRFVLHLEVFGNSPC
ncbi:hypothetical protein AAG906_018451 [Vitis piasezkii]